VKTLINIRVDDDGVEVVDPSGDGGLIKGGGGSATVSD
jgi:hypothetical protein